ncbi:hypothetical protein K505DRAFT_332814 [Melanomma pulvis-pyrius CBS 109.77]|uniref:Uncharacterized protein n=1 Tax=Melanomma pulvis-pyrius CBS 109.77 TaxID=1314802 RepID=A0A6A6XTT7_9PLEO|nr:hypothetical protein K505DRAFT_332814 [Melanomma pulvis-pyrius CBS 109.77]
MSQSTIAAISLAAIMIQLLWSIITISLLLYFKFKRIETDPQNTDARSSISSDQSPVSAPSDEERNIEAAEFREHPHEDTWTRDGARNPAPSTSTSDESIERTRISRIDARIPGPLPNHINRKSRMPRLPSPDFEEPRPTPSLAQNINHHASPLNSLTESSPPASPSMSRASARYFRLARAPRSPVPRRIPTTEEVKKDIEEMFEDALRQSQLLYDRDRAKMAEEEKRRNGEI